MCKNKGAASAAGWRRLVFWWCVTRTNELAECNAPHCSPDRWLRRNLKASIMYAECLIVRSLTCSHRCVAIRDFNAALSQKSRAASELFFSWFALSALALRGGDGDQRRASLISQHLAQSEIENSIEQGLFEILCFSFQPKVTKAALSCNFWWYKCGTSTSFTSFGYQPKWYFLRLKTFNI
jgi:hypothetical protein